MSKLVPDWPAPMNVKTLITTRQGGFSAPPYESNNLGLHVGDDPDIVKRNRAAMGLPCEPRWLDQIHSAICLDADVAGADGLAAQTTADACVTRRRGQVLAVMAADCLPVLLTNRDGSAVAVAHAGWRGLADGILASVIAAFDAGQIMAWLGPAIGPCHYEVGASVRECFPSDVGFVLMENGQYRMDLYQIARSQLESRGVAVFGGGLCTYCDPVRFFSYRRDGVTGRMAGFIWLA